jgi:AGCS family alanine or glycine:cation symporter
MVVFGALQEVPLIWGAGGPVHGPDGTAESDCVLLLTNVAFKAIHDYDMKLREGKEPRFDKSKYPELDHHIEGDVW